MWVYLAIYVGLVAIASAVVGVLLYRQGRDARAEGVDLRSSARARRAAEGRERQAVDRVPAVRVRVSRLGDAAELAVTDRHAARDPVVGADQVTAQERVRRFGL